MDVGREQRSERASDPRASEAPHGPGPAPRALQAAGAAAVERMAAGPQRARPFPEALLRPGNRFDGIDNRQWVKVLSTPLPDGPSVVGPIDMSVVGIALGQKYFFVLVENGEIARWCPLEQVPMGGTRLHDYLVFRTPSYVEVQQDRVTDEAQIAAHAPERSAHDVKDRADTARELNRDLEHYVATGSSISQAKAQVRGVHEDVLVEMVLGTTRIVETMATQGAMLEDAVEATEGLFNAVSGKLRARAAAKPYAPTLNATEEQHSLASTPGVKEMELTPDNCSGMSRMQDLHRDPHLAPELRDEFIADTHAALAKKSGPTDALHWEMSKVAYAQHDKYLRVGPKPTVEQVKQLGGLRRVVSMKTVLANMLSDDAYERAYGALRGRIPQKRSRFSWAQHAGPLFEAYKKGELQFHLSDLDPNSELRGAHEGSSAWTFSQGDAGSATSSPALLQKQLAVNEEYAAGYVMVEVAPEVAVAHGAARPTAIDLTNNPLGKLNGRHHEPFGRTSPTHPDHKEVRELVLEPIPLSKTTIIEHVR